MQERNAQRKDMRGRFLQYFEKDRLSLVCTHTSHDSACPPVGGRAFTPITQRLKNSSSTTHFNYHRTYFRQADQMQEGTGSFEIRPDEREAL
jgi:hypothetical protein